MGRITEIEGKAAIYIRISDKYKQTLRRQTVAMSEWLERNPGIELVKRYDEKKTARGGVVRKELNQLIRDAKSHKFNIAIFWELSRLGRNVWEALGRLRELNTWGCSVYLCELGMLFDPTDPADCLVVNQMLAMSQFEHQINSKRTKEGMHAKKVQIEQNIVAGKLPKGARQGIPSMLEQWIKDPTNTRVGKKHLLAAPDPEREAMFRAIWLDEKVTNVYDTISHWLPLPINPECDNKCAINGGKLVKAHGAKCYCGKNPSRKTIHKARVALGLEARNPHSFGSARWAEKTHDSLVAELKIAA